jgi:hypothetical protein
MPHIFEDEEGMPQGTDIDFLWGKALVEAYKKNKKNQYPGIQIDASILDFCNDQKINEIILESIYYEYSNNPKIIFLDILGVSTIFPPLETLNYEYKIFLIRWMQLKRKKYSLKINLFF